MLFAAFIIVSFVAAVLAGYICGKGTLSGLRPAPNTARLKGGAAAGTASSSSASSSRSTAATSSPISPSSSATTPPASRATGTAAGSTVTSTTTSPTHATAASSHATTKRRARIRSPHTSSSSNHALPISPFLSTSTLDSRNGGATPNDPPRTVHDSHAPLGLNPRESELATLAENDVSSTNTSPAGTPRSSSRRSSMADDSEGPSRVIIVAKQLPVYTRRLPPGEDGLPRWSVHWEDNRSFISGLRALKERGFDVRWVGVPNLIDDTLADADEREAYEDLLNQYDCYPVFLAPVLADRFFNGCKSVLWPMLHYVLPQSNQQFAARWDEHWQAYTAANTAYATITVRCCENQNDVVWVHNYHLLLLPSFVRRQLPRAKIGLFIHTPFPSSDVFRVFPTRQNILSSIMAADVLGFHTFDYARHFLSCIKRVMDLDFETLHGGAFGIKYNGRFVSILISHVGLDSQMFRTTALSPSVQERIAAIKAKYAPRKIVLSSGDLDAVKGGLFKYQAYDRFFQHYPAWIGKMTFVEILSKSNALHLDHTRDMDSLLREEVAAIHDKYGKDALDCIEVTQALPLEEMVAYMNASDACIVPNWWDGLNLLPFEYTASQSEVNPGALIISEFMGCSRALNGVLRINPWNLDAVAKAIHIALNMPLDERQANHARRYAYVMNHTIGQWGVSFIEHLERITKLCEGMNYVQVGWGSNVKLMGLRSDFTHLDEETVTSAYRKAMRRVLLLDYDGTLTSAEKTAHKSRLMGPSKAVRAMLQQLSRDEENTVFIMSGRTRSTLSEWFPVSEFPNLGLAAEKGLFLRWPARLMMSCRQDLRRDANLRRKVEDRQKEILSAAADAAAAASTLSVLALDARRRSSSQGDEDEKTNGSGAGGRRADAHMLLEEAAVPLVDADWEYMIALDREVVPEWKSLALNIIRSYTEQTDGAWIEVKEFAIVWHYEQADPEYGRMQSSEMQKYLMKILANPAVDVVRYDYNRILEVKPHGVSKGLAATAILEELFNQHREREKRRSRPSSPPATTSTMHDGSADAPAGFGRLASSGNRSFKDLSSLASMSPPHTPTPGGRAQTSISSFNSIQSVGGPAVGPATTATAAASLPPFIFCVGDDRSDEDMFLSVQNKDYLERRLRTTVYPHPPLMHHGSTSSLPTQDALRRSLSAITTGKHHKAQSMSLHGRNKRRGGAADGDIDEKTARERRKNRIVDPFTFTVCVGMKPSNAHYYLHDDEEVVRLLCALARSSQREAQSRAADEQLLGHAGRGGVLDLSHSAPNILRPIDIPTSPPIPLNTIDPAFRLQQMPPQLQHRSSMPSLSSTASAPQQSPQAHPNQIPAATLRSFAALGGGHRHSLPSSQRNRARVGSDPESRSSSDFDAADEQDDATNSSDDEWEARRRKEKVLAPGGLRRAL